MFDCVMPTEMLEMELFLREMAIESQKFQMEKSLFRLRREFPK